MICNLKGSDNADIQLNLSCEAAGNIEDSAGAIVIPMYEGKLVMAYHTRRNSWEFPGGKRKPHETVLQCAERETFEESGAKLDNIKCLGYYLVTRDGGTRKTAIYVAKVKELQAKPHWSEMSEVESFSNMPENITYKDRVYENTIEYIKKEYSEYFSK